MISPGSLRAQRLVVLELVNRTLRITVIIVKSPLNKGSYLEGTPCHRVLFQQATPRNKMSDKNIETKAV